jgi:hypothetical protein
MTAVWKETSGTLTNTTVSIPANAARRELIVSNPSDTVMTLSIGGTATASVGITIAAGDNIRLGQTVGPKGNTVPSQALSLFCAGTAKAYTIYEC